MTKIIEEVDENCDGTTPSGAGRDGYVTYEETDPILLNAIQKFVMADKEWRETEPPYPYYPKDEPLLLTVHHAWSGWSEYTITSTWDEVTVKWGGFERHFESMSDFLAALAKDADKPDHAYQW